MASADAQRIELLSDAIASIFGTVLIIPLTQGLLHIQEAFIDGIVQLLFLSFNIFTCCHIHTLLFLLFFYFTIIGFLSHFFSLDRRAKALGQGTVPPTVTIINHNGGQ